MLFIFVLILHRLLFLHLFKRFGLWLIDHGWRGTERATNAASGAVRDGNDAGHVQSDDQLVPPEVHQFAIFRSRTLKGRKYLLGPLRGQISRHPRSDRKETHLYVRHWRRNDEKGGDPRRSHRGNWRMILWYSIHISSEETAVARKRNFWSEVPWLVERPVMTAKYTYSYSPRPRNVYLFRSSILWLTCIKPSFHSSLFCSRYVFLLLLQFSRFKYIYPPEFQTSHIRLLGWFNIDSGHFFNMSAPTTANMTSMTPNIKLAPGAVVCAESDLRGDITIGAKTVIHPKAQVWIKRFWTLKSHYVG